MPMSSTISTPSGRIIAAAQAQKETTDVRGRKITYRRLGALDRARLFKAIGPANATNAPYMGMAMLAASVTSIDNLPTIFPSRDSEIEAAIAKLDDDGMDAVAVALSQDLLPNDKPAVEAADPGAADVAVPV